MDGQFSIPIFTKSSKAKVGPFCRFSFCDRVPVKIRIKTPTFDAPCDYRFSRFIFRKTGPKLAIFAHGRPWSGDWSKNGIVF